MAEIDRRAMNKNLATLTNKVKQTRYMRVANKGELIQAFQPHGIC